jgi:hypothetical protein
MACTPEALRARLDRLDPDQLMPLDVIDSADEQEAAIVWDIKVFLGSLDVLQQLEGSLAEEGDAGSEGWATPPESLWE